MNILPLNKCTPDTPDSCCIAYVGETSWPGVEGFSSVAVVERARDIVRAKPKVCYTTPQLAELAAAIGIHEEPTGKFSTQFISHPVPWIPFGELLRKEIGEPRILRFSSDKWISLESQIAYDVILHDSCTVAFGCTIEPGTVIGGSSVSCDMYEGKLYRRPQVGGVSIGAGTHIGPNCSIERGTLEDTLIGERCIIDSGVKVSHNCIIADDVVILGNSVLEGHVDVRAKAYIGSGVVVRRGVTIGTLTVIGAGAVVTKDIPDNAIAYGNPARVVRMR